MSTVPEIPTKERFAENLRRLRKEKKLTQQELADVLGVSAPVISNYERGTENVGADTIDRFADVLGVDPMLFIVQPPKNGKKSG